MHSKGAYWVFWLLIAIALFGFAMAFYRYPVENHFSIMTSTISYLGSPDAHRNPEGFRFYQFGMSSALIVFGILVLKRHGQLSGLSPRLFAIATFLYFAVFTLLLASVWIPDSKEWLWRGKPVGELHTDIAVLGIVLAVFPFTIDSIALRRSGLKAWPWQGPFLFFGFLAVSCVCCLFYWEWKVSRNSNLSSWPGEGICSTPLWEWILFLYMSGFLFWIASRKPSH